MNVPEIVEHSAAWMEGHINIWNGVIGK